MIISLQVDGYNVSICSALPQAYRPDCPENSAVCSKDGSGGLATKQQINIQGDDVILQYGGGNDCGSEGNTYNGL